MEMFFVVIPLLIVSLLIRLYFSYRQPENRSILGGVLKDKKAIMAGAVWILWVLVIGFVSGGLHSLARNVIPAFIGGFVVAAIVNWFSKRRTDVHQ